MPWLNQYVFAPRVHPHLDIRLLGETSANNKLLGLKGATCLHTHLYGHVRSMNGSEVDLSLVVVSSCQLAYYFGLCLRNGIGNDLF